MTVWGQVILWVTSGKKSSLLGLWIDCLLIAYQFASKPHESQIVTLQAVFSFL